MAQLKSYSSIDDAKMFAKFAYFGIDDKAGIEYIHHPMRVMETVKRRGGVPYLQVAALFHDIFEDTVVEPQHVLDFGFSKDAVDVAVLLTRGDHTGPCDYTAKSLCDGCYAYYAAIREHPGALKVKDADIDDNTDETRLSYLPPKTQVRSRAKYAYARELLHG